MTGPVRHLTASAVVLDERRGRVLLIWHKASRLWMFPGGHIDAGEAPHEAALREVMEETGLPATIVNTAPWLPGLPSAWVTDEYPAPAKPARPGKPAEAAHSHVDLLFLAVADSMAPTAPALDEVSAARWAPIAGLATLPPNLRREVPRLAYLALEVVRDLM